MSLSNFQFHQYPGDIALLGKWAVNRINNFDRNPPEPYKSWIREIMPEGCKKDIDYWVGITTSDSPLNPEDPSWVLGYPHTHVESRGWHPKTTTVVTYLSDSVEGGAFAIGGREPTDEYELIDPVPGMTAVVDGQIWHGVKRVIHGTRVALLATGPYIEE